MLPLEVGTHDRKLGISKLFMNNMYTYEVSKKTHDISKASKNGKGGGDKGRKEGWEPWEEGQREKRGEKI